MSERMTEPVYIVVTVELSNGHFKSSLKQPLEAPVAEKQRFVEKWLDLMRFGLETGATAIDAEFAPLAAALKDAPQ
jgi:hypothetical protein